MCRSSEAEVEHKVPHYVPHQGRMAPDGVTPLQLRMNMDWTIKDTHGDLPVYVLVEPPPDSRAKPRDLHWMLAWRVQEEDNFWRVIQVVRERPVGSDFMNNYLTNSGPATHALLTSTTRQGRLIYVGTLSRDQRRELEGIAEEHPVREPDGTWNCQNFLVEVLELAIARGIVDKETARKAIADASGGTLVLE
ncbi:hypothetical protein OE88DRAFT_1654454 [Heliocybe sulcata]|uniref:Uncharacterized protein n=1 Tax=Heliocybe sulcata TaxID=5364 RepID=A0A5C3N9S7_9AGAM|nr:hypothetical protein OE88DRAFT_1654454 [Heliocybe sulcata]